MMSKWWRFWDRNFREVQTKEPARAVQVLFDKALSSVSITTDSDIHEQYASLKEAWGSKVLVDGTEWQVKRSVLRNIEVLAEEPGFITFQIVAMPERSCAQMNSAFGYASPERMLGIRVWRIDQVYFLCGYGDGYWDEETMPPPVEYYEKRIGFYTRKDEYDRAAEECKIFLEREGGPESSRATLQRWYGYCFLMKENYDRAVTELDKALAMHPQGRVKYLAHSNLASAYEDLGKYSEAREQYTIARRLATDYSDRVMIDAFLRVLESKEANAAV